MSKKPGYVMKWLGMAIVILILGVILTLLSNDTSFRKSWRKNTPSQNMNIHIMNRPLPLERKQPTLDVMGHSDKEYRHNKRPVSQRNNSSVRNTPPTPTEVQSTPTRGKKPDLSGIEPIKIVQYIGAEWMPQMKNCDIPCVHSWDRSDASLNTASAIVFHVPSFWGSPRKKLNGKGSQALTVAFSKESSENYPRLKDLSDYDLTVTYNFDSDVPMPYYGFEQDLHKQISEWPWEKREPAIAFVARNCNPKSRRNTLVRMLQKYVRVDSLSSCINNHPWPSDIPRTNKDALLMRYRMYLAAENSIDKDYVTNKVYGGLINGAVPIYLGAPNIEEFVPAHSVIPVPPDFTEDDVVRIAGIVKQIFTNKTFYEEWIEFKKYPFEEKFERKFGMGRTHIWCRLCRKLYALKNGYGWDKELQQI